MIDMKPIKRNIAEKFPDSLLAMAILQEPDMISESDFLAKVPVWLLISIKTRQVQTTGGQ